MSDQISCLCCEWHSVFIHSGVPELLLTQSIIELIFLVARLHFSFDPFNQPTFALCEVRSRAIAGGIYLLCDSLEEKKLPV